VALEVNSKNSIIGSIFLWLITPEEAFIGLTVKLIPKMSTRTRSEIIRPNEDAHAAFVSRKAEIDAILTRLQALSADHFGYAPDDVTWGHVGTLENYADLLKRITDMAFNEGEHAG
jgi:hypothetical protein